MSLPLIDTFDNSELIRDRIAAILIAEVARQKQLAVAAVAATPAHYAARTLSFGNAPGFVAGPTDWDIDIYAERLNPWDATKDDGGLHRPIVNIMFAQATNDKGESNTIEKQAYDGTYHIDCYGFGKSERVNAGQHRAGDQMAAYAAQRTARLIRNILMASTNTYLQFKHDADRRQVVKGRMVSEVLMFQPQQDGIPVQHACGARLVLAVEYNEYAPQYVVETLDGVDLNLVHGDPENTDSLSYG